MQEQDIKNIIFDVGMVLVDFCWKAYCESLGFSKETIQQFGSHMVLSDVWNQLDEGTISLEDANAIFRTRMPEYEKEIALFWERQEGMVREYEYALPMIEKLKELGYHVYLLSNYPMQMYECHWPRFRFIHKVDGYVVSSLNKVVKPNSRIYQLLCEQYSLEPNQCVFVDDRDENVKAAIQNGMQGIVFEGYEAFVEKIRQMGVEL